MTNLPDPMTRDQLLRDFATEWDALMAVVGPTDNPALLDHTDAAGWNTRDHLAHLIAWLEGVIRMIRDGTPQHIGTGVSLDLFVSGDYDAMNEVIRQKTIDLPVASVIARLTANHDEIVGIVAGMSDDALLTPVDDFVAGGGEFGICFKIDGNGPHHYREHRGWIEEILAS